jgi:uncharacterized membrane-anchored protein
MTQIASTERLKTDLAVKVAEVTAVFWVAKLATTWFGEDFSDYIFFNDYIGRGRAILMGLGLLLICLGIQMTRKKYIAFVYWLAVTAVSIFGTMSADYLNKNLGMALWQSTLLLLALQTAVFIAWYMTFKTLSIHSVYTGLRELFYWLTVIFTFSLGTAAGDYVAGPLNFGTLDATLLFLGVIIVPLVAWRVFNLSAVMCFWFAYTITRPLGASFGDYLGVPAPYGDGLQLGTGPMSLASGIVLIACIVLIVVKFPKAATPDAEPVR